MSDRIAVEYRPTGPPAAALAAAGNDEGMLGHVERVQRLFRERARYAKEYLLIEVTPEFAYCKQLTSGEFVRFPLPATGKSVTSSAIHVFRIARGKIVEQWGATDAFATMRQLGLMPRPEVQ